MAANLKQRIGVECTTANGRFGAMAALAPQQRQCEFGSYYPAGTLVKPPLRQAARPLGESGRQYSRTMCASSAANNEVGNRTLI